MRAITGLRLASTLIPALGIVACTNSSAKAPSSARAIQTVADPPGLSPSDLAILEGQSRVRIGDSPEDVDRAFPTPANAFPFKELPRQFSGQYRARGFETSTNGFGAIYFDNRLAAGIYRQENVTAGEVQSIVRLYAAEVKEADQTLPSGSIQYWFWNREDQRLMICSVPDRANPLRYDVTVGLGHEVVMDALRMSYPAAREDQSIGERNRTLRSVPSR